MKYNILKILHKHKYILRRWHIVHGPNGMEPPEIEVEYVCKICNKKLYKYFDVSSNIRYFESIVDLNEIYDPNE